MKRLYKYEKTPEARLAAIASNLMPGCGSLPGVGDYPDFADFRDALRPYLEREFLLVKIEEARLCGADSRRVADLQQGLEKLDRELL